MRKNLPAAAFAAVCLLLCAALPVGFLLDGPSAAGANERLTPKPVLTKPDGGLNTAFLSEFADYYSDRFFLRQELISAHSYLTAAVFGRSAAEDVILGTNGWLYYADTLDDYTGAETLTPGELEAIANNLALMQEYCRAEGAQFAFAAAPNKNSLYAGNMPDFGAAAAEHDVHRLHTLLAERGVNCVDLFSLFGAQEETLYFAHDSHWNSKGAALAADGINAAFGRDSEYFADGFDTARTHTGDLFEMLYPAGTDTETDPVYGGGLSFVHENGAVRPDSITIDTAGGETGALLCFRDSFGNLLYPYLADSFASARFSRATAYDLTLVSRLGADCVLVELVERNLDYLLTYVPVMPAPERQLGALPEVSGTAELSADPAARAPEGCVLTVGRLPDGYDEGTAVYMLCSGRVYEAFTLADGGVAAYLPADGQVGALLFCSGGELTAYKAAAA